MTKRTASAVLFLLLALTACTAGPKKVGPEEDTPLDGAHDSFLRPIDHGALSFGRVMQAELTSRESFHAWTFTLDAAAAVALRTEPAMEGLSEVDTVLYLYRESDRGWGRPLASNDDAPGTLFSALSRELRAGRYRVIVKGYRRTSVGPFALLADCTGEGCGPSLEGCLFGDTYRDIPASRRLEMGARERWTSAEEITDLQRAQVVRAVQQSSHTDVVTAEEAFGRVDQNEVNHVPLYDAEGGRAFTVIEYGAGDNSYGAIFGEGSTTLAARIQDGDLLECTPSFEVCMLGSTFRAFAEGDTLEVVSDAEIHDAAFLDAAGAAQLVRTVQLFDPAVRTASEAIARADDAVVQELVRLDPATDRTFVAFELSGNGRSFGLAFEDDAVVPVAHFYRGLTYGCTATRTPR